MLISYNFLSILLLITVHLSSLAIFSSAYNVDVLSIFTATKNQWIIHILINSALLLKYECIREIILYKKIR